MDHPERRDIRPMVKRSPDGMPRSPDVKQRQFLPGGDGSPMMYRRQSMGSSSTKEMTGGNAVALDPASPSPGQGKRPQAASQDTAPRPLPKRPKIDQELGLHVLLPNGTAVKFTADTKKLQSVVELLDLVKVHETDQQQEREKSPSRDVDWAKVWLEDTLGNKLNTDSLLKAIFSAKSSGTLQILLHDGLPNSHIDKNMWNVTPKAEMLGTLPQGYTLETALADQVDNALQAVWHNKEDIKLVSVTLARDKITIFDTGQGMDGSSENSIADWGTVGGSKHRAVHHKALGGEPPFLKPYLGKYGAGGVAAALHLGSLVTVCSKTKQSKKVVSLVLEPKVLLGKQKSEGTRVWKEGDLWKATDIISIEDEDFLYAFTTAGEFRDMTEEEKKMAPHGSFTRVEISKLKSQYCIGDELQYWKVEQIRQLLKDIYFPYIQVEMGSSSKTVYPVQFEVNGENLTNVTACETAISKMHTCRGDPFVFDIRMTKSLDERDKEDLRATRLKSQVAEEANARVTCHYYPNQKGKESLDTVLEEVKALNPQCSLTFETMHRVSIRWLGRLLPEVKWPILPLMEVSSRKEQKSGVRRPWSKRVLAFVDTDGGFHPNQSKTELERDQPFAKALQVTGSGDFSGTSAAGVSVSFMYDGRKLTSSLLTEAYMEWVIKMHSTFDEDYNFLDEPIYIFNHPNAQKELGVDKDKQVILFHKHMKDARGEFKVDPGNPLHIKLPRGNGSKSELFATVEFFFHDGGEDEHGEVKFLCRPLEVAESDGCRIFRRSENRHFVLNKSVWFPAALLSTPSVKRLDAATWKKKIEELSNKSPGKIEIMNLEDTKKLEMGQTFPGEGSKFEAGHTLPTDFLVVVRPKRGSGPSHKQGMIVTEPMHLVLTVTHCTCSSPCWKRKALGSSSGKASSPNVKDDHGQMMCTLTAQSAVSKSGVKGLYMFSLGSSEVSRLLKEGIYTFHISVEGEKYKDLQNFVSIRIVPSRVTSKWTLCTHKEDCGAISSHHHNLQQPVTTIRLNERLQEDLFVQKYDEFDNRQMFERSLDLEMMVVTAKGESLEMRSKNQATFVKAGYGGRSRLQIKICFIPREERCCHLSRLYRVQDTRKLWLNVLFGRGSLELVEPTYEGVLRAYLQNDQYAEIDCKVLPGSLASIQVEGSKPLISKGTTCFNEALQPGEIIKKLALQGLDACGNKIEKGQKVLVHLEGLEFQDNNGNTREVDDYGCLELGGLLKVTCHYNSGGSINLMSGNRMRLCTISFKTVSRQLIATQVPRKSYVGRQLEGIFVKIVDDCGKVDATVDGYIHSISVDWIKGVTCPFTKGECTLPNFKLPEKPGMWEGKIYFSANTSLSVTIQVQLELATACSLGPARRMTGILTAKCGVPFVVPFSVYDDQHQPALLTESMKQTIRAKAAAKDSGDESHPIFRRCVVECKDVKMSRTTDIPGYEAHIVISGSVGTYVTTLMDTCFDLKGQVETTCNLEHGHIARLITARSDGTNLQTLPRPLTVLEAKRCSSLPRLTVTLLDSEDNICSSCEGRLLRMKLLDCEQWSVQTAVVRRGVAYFEACSLLVPVGGYQVSVELDSSPDDLYSLEEEPGPIRAHFALRVNPGNYPSALRLVDPATISISRTGEVIQYLPKMSVLVDSADGMRLQCRPIVGVKLHGGNSDDPKEYFGTFVETSEVPIDPLGMPEDDLASRETGVGSVGPVGYEFAQVCVPHLAGTYVMDFFLRGGDLLAQSRHLIVKHGPPTRLEIIQREQGQEMDVLQVSLVDGHGNLCEDIYGLDVALELGLGRSFAAGPSPRPSSVVEPCVVYSRSAAVVKRGNADFGVFELSRGVPGMYTLKVFAVDCRDYVPSQFSLTCAEVQLFVTHGNISDTIQQGFTQLQRAAQDNSKCLSSIILGENMVEQLKAALRTLEEDIRKLQGEIDRQEGRKTSVQQEQEAARDDEIIEAELGRPLRTPQTVIHEIRGWARRGNNAPLLLLEAQSEDNFLSSQSTNPVAKDILGLVVTLARVESEDLNRMLSEYMGVSTLLSIVSRSQRGVSALEEYDLHGNIIYSHGLHGFAQKLKDEVRGRYEVLSLMDIRPYLRNDRRPAVNMNHPQRLLYIDPPSLSATSKVPVGFLGYAVNLLHLSPEQINVRVVTRQGEAGLRESLFFHYLKLLQVYDTRQHMLAAKGGLEKFAGGAISLDGGSIHANMRQQLGRRSDRVAVSFSMVPPHERKMSLLPPACDAFQRQADMKAINTEIKNRQDSLATMKERFAAHSDQLKHVDSVVATTKKEQARIEENSRFVKKQIAEFKKAADQIGSRHSDGDCERMRAFMM